MTEIPDHEPASDAAGDVESTTGGTVEDVVVVDTGDALLVTTYARAQDVKAIVDRLKQDGRTDLT